MPGLDGGRRAGQHEPVEIDAGGAEGVRIDGAVGVDEQGRPVRALAGGQRRDGQRLLARPVDAGVLGDAPPREPPRDQVEPEGARAERTDARREGGGQGQNLGPGANDEGAVARAAPR